MGNAFERILDYNYKNYDKSTEDFVRFRKQIIENEAYKVENDVIDLMKAKLESKMELNDALAEALGTK